MYPSADSDFRDEKKRERPPATTLQFISHDILRTVFLSLDVLDVVRCSIVCKSWNAVINRLDMLRLLCYKNSTRNGPTPGPSTSERSVNDIIEEWAMKYQRASLHSGSVFVDQWKGHGTCVDQCRMRRGLILTGVGDKVIRLWSSESYKCLEEYSLPDLALVDFEFDENKIVGLLGTQLCIWRRNGTGTKTIFPSREGTFAKGSCMRYLDPEAVVGCEDGAVRVFDMYSRKCSQIIRMHSSDITSLSLGEDQLIVSGSSLGSISLYDPSLDQKAITLKRIDRTGIRTLCYNPSSHLLFAGSTTGSASCWDLRMMKCVWENRVSPNVLYSMGHLHSDKSTLVVGGIDGVLRVIDQNTGQVLSSYAMDEQCRRVRTSSTVMVERKRVRSVTEDTDIDEIPRSARLPIRSLAVGMNKVVTSHNDKYVRVWKFSTSI